MAIGCSPHAGCLRRYESPPAGVPASKPWTRIHDLLQRFSCLECRRCRGRFRNGLAGPGVASGTGRSAPGAEGPESRNPDFLAIGKCVADGREHTVHSLPGERLARAASRSAIFALFIRSLPPRHPVLFCSPIPDGGREDSARTRAQDAVTARGSTWKPRRKSSNGTPSSIQSKSCCTGRSVPRKQGTPLMRAGSVQTASSSGMGRSGSVSASVFMAVAVGGQESISGSICPGPGVSMNPRNSVGRGPSAASIARQSRSPHETALPPSPSFTGRVREGSRTCFRSWIEKACGVSMDMALHMRALYNCRAMYRRAAEIDVKPYQSAWLLKTILQFSRQERRPATISERASWPLDCDIRLDQSETGVNET